MTKQELKTQLTSAGYENITEQEYGQEGNYTLYSVKANRVTGNVLRSHTFDIAVDSSGNAYFKGEDPMKGNFTQDLQAYLDGLKQAGTIVGSRVNVMNSEQQFAEVVAWWEGTDPDGNPLIQRGKFFVDKNSNNEFQYSKM